MHVYIYRCINIYGKYNNENSSNVKDTLMVILAYLSMEVYSQVFITGVCIRTCEHLTNAASSLANAATARILTNARCDLKAPFAANVNVNYHTNIFS